MRWIRQIIFVTCAMHSHSAWPIRWSSYKAAASVKFRVTSTSWQNSDGHSWTGQREHHECSQWAIGLSLFPKVKLKRILMTHNGFKCAPTNSCFVQSWQTTLYLLVTLPSTELKILPHTASQMVWCCDSPLRMALLASVFHFRSKQQHY